MLRKTSRDEYPVESNIYITPNYAPKQKEENKKTAHGLGQKERRNWQRQLYNNKKNKKKNGWIVESSCLSNRRVRNHHQ